jgi:hypothetical protein
MFQPDGMRRQFSIPMHELNDKNFEGHSMLGNFVSRAQERLGNTGSFEERVRRVDEMLLRHSVCSPGLDDVSAAAHRILQSSGRVGFSNKRPEVDAGWDEFVVGA